jgi:hypothetical protein
MANCLKSGTNGSCPRQAVEGSLFCDRHTDEGKRVRNYLIEDARLKVEFERLAGADLYSIRDEVALLRTMINDRFNMARSEAERIVAYREIGSWLGTLDKLVTSLNKLEKDTDQVLTKETLLSIGLEIVKILDEEIKSLPGHEQVIDAVAVRIVPLIEQASNKQ